MKKVTRRTFVASMSAAFVLPPPALPAPTLPAPDVVPEPLACRTTRPETPYVFFDAREARFIESACERLVPHEDGPGAFGPEVAQYLDRQLGGPWGAGRRPYRTGPWQPGTAAAGALAASPASLFRTVLRAIDRRFEAHGTCFSELDPSAQTSFLRWLASGAALLDGVPAAAFFDLLLAMTVEGFLSGSSHAAARGMIAWPLKGFPGAYFREDRTPERSPAATPGAPKRLTAKNPTATSQSQR